MEQIHQQLQQIVKFGLSADKMGLLAYYDEDTFYHIHSDELSPLQKWIHNLLIQQGECEVVIKFDIPKDKMEYIYNAIKELNQVGVHFDTGGSTDENDIVHYDWEFDWSLKGAKVFFKRFKDKKGD